jgi:hypothetical protein
MRDEGLGILDFGFWILDFGLTFTFTFTPHPSPLKIEDCKELQIYLE